MDKLPTVIIPVFNARSFLGKCLDSLSEFSPGASVLLIDDASTDPEVRPMLRSWAAKSTSRRLEANRENQGFVRTANRGMRSVAGDVVLLNTDTEVTPRWLELLARCLDSDPHIATATPWSNNGEIVSFPQFCRAQEPPEEASMLASAVTAVCEPEYPDIPTAVGFCMAISRRAIERIGYFDEDTFGRGYGEENDFCLRAAEAGLRNVLCDNAYVVHHGGASFGSLGISPGEDSMRRLLEKHPAYADLVGRYIDEDPLAEKRARLWRAASPALGAESSERVTVS